MREVRNTPIFKKSEEIFQTIRTITDLFPGENDYLQSVKEHLLENAMVIQAKLSGAFAVDLWDLKMENACIIRKCARELQVSYHSLQMAGFEETKYYLIVRKQIEEFRILFREWVATFDPKKFIVDEWGLLNPPGILQDHYQDDTDLNWMDDENDLEE